MTEQKRGGWGTTEINGGGGEPQGKKEGMGDHEAKWIELGENKSDRERWQSKNGETREKKRDTEREITENKIKDR